MSAAQPTANDLYHAAQALIKSGQPVFPCRPSGEQAKKPFTKNGFKDATLDVEQVKRWWKARGNAALGIPTGVLWDVLDVDVKRDEDGRVHLPYLHRLGLLNGCKRIVRTPSGGWHLYFKTAPGLTNKTNPTLGLDVRSVGGYVLAPPSYIETTDYAGAYVDLGETDESTDEPLYWNLILNAITPMNTKTKQPVELLNYERRSSLASLRGWLSERREGERNNSLHWAVCRCIDAGIDPHELTEVAILLGLTEEEIAKTIDSAVVRSGVAVESLLTEAEALFGRN